MCFASVNGIEIYCERHGEGEPLLFISGLGGHVAEVPHLADSYSPHFEMIAFDGRGNGRSTVPVGAYSIPQFADDAARLLDALGIAKAIVYGSSLGGMIAQELTLQHPERVRGLILGCTTGGATRGVRPSGATVQRMLQNQSLSGDDAAVAGWRLGYSERYIAEHFDELLARSRVVSPYASPRESYVRQIVAAAQHDTWDRLSAIVCPVMIIHGADDVMLPVGNAHMLKERMPHAELHELEGMGHGYNLEAREIADPLVIDFVQRIASKPAGGSLVAPSL
jgi:pimeloyl-ACP methyl ester carboxylesterase